MANTKASKKDIDRIKRNKLRNHDKKDELKTLFRDLKKMDQPSKEDCLKQVAKIYQILDRLSRSGRVVSPNKASRLKKRANQIAKSLI